MLITSDTPSDDGTGGAALTSGAASGSAAAENGTASSSASSAAAPKKEECTDLPAPGSNSCQQQKGECSWLVGAWGLAALGSVTWRGVKGRRAAPVGRSALEASRTLSRPTYSSDTPHTTDWGKCYESWFTASNYCTKTCGRCGGQGAAPAAPAGCTDVPSPDGHTCQQQKGAWGRGWSGVGWSGVGVIGMVPHFGLPGCQGSVLPD